MKNLIKSKQIITIIVLIFSFLLINTAFAQTPAADTTERTDSAANTAVTLTNPLKYNTPQQLIGQVIKTALGVVGSLALLMFIYGGFTWMLAAGNAEKVTKGKDILVWAVIGLVVIFSAYAILVTVFEGLGIVAS